MRPGPGRADHRLGAGRCRHHVEGAPVVAPEHAGEAGLGGGDPVDDVPALGHQHALVGDGVGHPHVAVGVEADPVRRAPRERGPHPAPGELAVVADVEGGEPAGQRLGHDQGLPVGGDDRSVGEGHVLGGDVGRAVRVDADQGRGRRARGLHQRRLAPFLDEAVEVESEVPHVGPPGGIDDHVVAVEAGRRVEVPVLDEPTVGLEPVHGAGLAGHHQQSAVGEPAQPGRLAGDLELDPDVPRLARRQHRPE